MMEKRVAFRRVVRSLQGTFVVSVTALRGVGDHAVLDSVTVDGMGTVFRVPRRELKNIFVKAGPTLRLGELSTAGIRVVASPTSREIRVALCGGDSGASVNKTWVFDDRRGFQRSELVCEVWGNFSPEWRGVTKMEGYRV